MVHNYWDQYYKYRQKYLELKSQKDHTLRNFNFINTLSGQNNKPKIVRIIDKYFYNSNPIITCLSSSMHDLFDHCSSFDRINVLCDSDKDYQKVSNIVKKNDLNNIKIYHGGLKKLNRLKQDIVYILSSDKAKADTIIANGLNNETKLFVLKVPKDYDYGTFVKNIKYDHTDVYKQRVDVGYYFIAINK